MSAPITSFYLGLTALLLVFLSTRVIHLRRRHGIGLGSSDNRDVELAMRVQANLIEYAPFVFLLLYLLEARGIPAVWAHGFGAVFVVARLLHAWGFSHSKGVSFGRFAGTALTLTVLALLAGANIFHAFYD